MLSPRILGGGELIRVSSACWLCINRHGAKEKMIVKYLMIPTGGKEAAFFSRVGFFQSPEACSSGRNRT